MDFPFFFGTSGFPSHKVAEVLASLGPFAGLRDIDRLKSCCLGGRAPIT